MGAPLNPLAVHLGAGVVQIYVQEEDDGNENVEWEVTSSLSLAGPYKSYSNNKFRGPDGWIYNFPLSNTVYLRIRARYTDGTYSDWVQVRLGVAGKPRVRMQCRAIRGSIIPAGATFTCKKAKDRIVGFIAEETISFT